MTHDHGLHEPKKKESLIVPVLQTLLSLFLFIDDEEACDTVVT